MSSSNSAFVSQSIFLSQDILATLANLPEGKDILQTVFGDRFNGDAAIDWLKTEAQNNFLNFPTVEIIAAQNINYAQGAYAADNNTIYLAAEFVERNSLKAIGNVVLEEYGHFLDAQFNPTDTPGDEGYLFAGMAQQMSFTEQQIANIRAESDIATVIIDDNPLLIEQANPGDNPAFDLIGLTQLRNDSQFSTIDGSGFSVAVIDTGIDQNHPLIAPNYITGYDFFDDDDDPNDPDGHGTHVAGTVGAIDETIGVAPGVGLIGLRVLGSNGGSLSEVEDALEWVFDNREQYNITAVNLSLGLGFFTSGDGLQGDILSDDIQRLEDSGVTIVSAAGNDYFVNSGQPNQENLAFPAISSTLAVGAVWQDGSESNVGWASGSIDYTTEADRITSFSQRLDAENVVFAPGAFITSTIPGRGTGIFGGTSQASPHVAGVVALIQQASLEFNGRLLTPEEVGEILVTTGDQVVDGDDEDDNIINTGDSYVRINVYNAIVQVKEQSDNFAPPPENNPDEIVSGDSNGTIARAFIGPTIDGAPVSLIIGAIGQDGANIRDNDVDIYSFQLASPGTVGIELSSDLNNPSDFDSYLRLFDANGNELVFSDSQQIIASDDDLAFDITGTATEFNDSNNPEIVLGEPNQTTLVSPTTDAEGNYVSGNYGHRTDSFIGARVERGQVYYVGISDFSNQNYNPNNLSERPENGGGGSYELVTTFVNDDIDGSITQVNEITPLPIVDRLGVIGADGEREVGDRDVDFYRINSGDAGILEISATSSSEDTVNIVTTIFDSEGNRLGVNDQLNNSDSLLRYQIAPNTDYYVGITGFGNQNFDPFALGSGTGGDTGSYSLNSNLIPLEEAGDLIDNTIGSNEVQNIVSGETLLGNVGNDSGFIVGDTDIDIYRFVPTADATVNIRAIATEEFSADTYLRVFDANGNEIAANDNESNVNQGSLVQLDVTAGTEYYIGVNGSSPEGQQYDPFTGEGSAPGSQGNYSLSVSSGNDIVTGSTVYRFFRPDVGVHFYTASEFERDSIIANLPNYSYEGESYIAASETADPLTGARPVYRFFNNSTGAHLYTMSEAERDSISGNLPNYTYEGVAYYGYQSDRPGANPLYRFNNPVIDAHFYTPDSAERDSILANLTDYQLESDDGIAFYVEPIGDL